MGENFKYYLWPMAKEFWLVFRIFSWRLGFKIFVAFSKAVVLLGVHLLLLENSGSGLNTLDSPQTTSAKSCEEIKKLKDINNNFTYPPMYYFVKQELTTKKIIRQIRRAFTQINDQL